MNNIKDTKKQNLDEKRTLSKAALHLLKRDKDSFLKSLVEKSQKIVKALYLITEQGFLKDSLQSSIRQKSIQLMQALLDTMFERNKSMSLTQAQDALYEIVSYIEVASGLGFISDMNYEILVKELHILGEDIYREQNPKQSDQISLTELFYQKEQSFEDTKIFKKEEQIRETASFQKEEQTKQRLFTPRVQVKTPKKLTDKKMLKNKRHIDILSILKQKKNASIKDICLLFKDCSSKTIQRDLNELIQEKKVVKRGDRRWSVYNLK